MTMMRNFALSAVIVVALTACSNLVFVTDKDGNRQLYNMQVTDAGSTSTSVSLLSHNPSYNDSAPDVSPDTTKLAYSSVRSGQHVIVTRDRTDTSGTSEQVLHSSTSSRLMRPRWSCQQDLIAFAERTPGSNDAKIWLTRADGTGAPIHVVTPGTYAGHDWVHDGNLIIYSSLIPGSTPPTYGLSLAKSDGSGTGIGPIAEGVLPVTSHDGKLIAFVRRYPFAPGTPELIFVADSRTFAIEHQFSLQPYVGGSKIAAVGFTGDDQGLYIATDLTTVSAPPDDKRYELFRTKLDGSEQTRLTDNNDYDSQPDGIPSHPIPNCQRCAEVADEQETSSSQILTINGVQLKAAVFASGSSSSISITDYCVRNEGKRELKVGWSGSASGNGRFASIEFPAGLFGDGPTSVEVTGCHTHNQGLQLKAYDRNGNLLSSATHTSGQATFQLLQLSGGNIARVDVIGQEIGIKDICYTP
jgi:Tol biopolymer transport system component